jgi:predicted transcriptional regulator of viral defense system
MTSARQTRPVWARLYETAAGQEGYFTTEQAAEAGYSPPLLAKYLQSGKIVRMRRGIYRLVHYPPGEHEDLVVAWLWSERASVFSHETALALHDLSDVLPARIHLTLPAAWQRRRLRVPAGLVLHHADVDASDRTWTGAVPVTSPRRTLLDCIRAHVSPELLGQAWQQAVARGLLARNDVDELETVVRDVLAADEQARRARYSRWPIT